MATLALIPGTFDPVTVGHMALVERAAAEFDAVIVCILVNPDKTPHFDEATRLAMLRASTARFPNVRVMAKGGMTADLAASLGAVLVRGIRDEKDEAYERRMALFNRERAGVETVFYEAPASLSGVSSTRVREALERGEAIDAIVPREALPILREALRASE